jgi:hypothetical protein
VTCCCEHGSDLSASVIDGKFIKQLSDYQLPENDSASPS